MITSAQQRSLVSRWKSALFRANEADYSKALIAREIYEAFSGDKALADAWVHQHLSKAAGTKAMLGRMAQAVAELSEAEVWLAVGWQGVQRLLSLGKRDRSKRIQAILKEANGGELKKSKLDKVLPPKPKPKPQANRSEGRLPPVPAASPVQPDPEVEVLADELRRLAADPALGPLLSNYLSKQALEILGLAKPGKRRGA